MAKYPPPEQSALISLKGKELREGKSKAYPAGLNWTVTSSLIYKMLGKISFPFTCNLKISQGILDVGVRPGKVFPAAADPGAGVGGPVW